MPDQEAPKEEKSLIITKLEESGLIKAGAIPVLEGLENLSQSDIGTPVYIFAQPTSGTYGEHAGKFIDRGTGIPQDEIQCVLLKLLKSRNCWPKPFNPGDQRICWSKNSKVPSEEVGTPLALKCTTLDENGREATLCPKAMFGTKGEAPDCQITYTFIGFDIRMNTPFLISFKGKSIKPTKQLLNQFLRKQKSLWQALITISSAKPEDLGMARGQYYIIRFKIDWAETEAELNNLRPLYEAIAKKEQDVKEAQAESSSPVVKKDEEAPF